MNYLDAWHVMDNHKKQLQRQLAAVEAAMRALERMIGDRDSGEEAKVGYAKRED